MTVIWYAGCSARGMSQGIPETPQSPAEITLGNAIELLKTAKLASNRRPVYVKALVRVLRQITKGIEDRPLSYLDAPKIEAFLASRPFCPLVKKSVIGRVSTLFQFAKRRRLTKVNPCEEIEMPIIEWKAPTILTPPQVETLFRHCQKHWPERLAYLTLCTFAGLRPTEARQVSRSMINLDSGTIRIEAGISKVRQRRICMMHETARAWLAHALPLARLEIVESTRKAWVSAFCKPLGFKGRFPADCLRHSCASYLLAEKQDAPWVSMQLGNSPAILFRHYRELVTQEQTKAFWSILPHV